MEKHMTPAQFKKLYFELKKTITKAENVILFFERWPMEHACHLFLKRRCLYACFFVCMYVVRLPAYYVHFDRLNRLGSHTTGHQSPTKALLPSNVLLIDWCRSH